MTTTKAERDKTREIDAAATGGEWKFGEVTINGEIFILTPEDKIFEYHNIGEMPKREDQVFVVHAKAYLRKYANDIEVYRAVLLRMVNHYVSLVNSGDAGFWDPESEGPVIAARKALGDSE